MKRNFSEYLPSQKENSVQCLDGKEKRKRERSIFFEAAEFGQTSFRLLNVTVYSFKDYRYLEDFLKNSVLK